MAGNAANLSVDVVANTKAAERDLAAFTGKVGGFVGGMTAAVAGFAIDKVAQGATAAAGYLWDSADAFAAMEASAQTAGVVFGESASKLIGWSKTAATAVGLSATEATKAATTFAGYGKVIGLTGEDLVDFSTDTVALAADLAAFKDLPVEQAIRAIGSAFRGENDPLEAFITGLNDATVKAAYFNETGIEVTGTLTAQERTIGVLAAVQAQATDATGAWARESENLNSQTQITNAQAEDLQAAIGELVEPVKSLAIEGFGTLVGKLQEVADSEAVDNFKTKVGEVFAEGSPLRTWLSETGTAIYDAVQAKFESFLLWWDTEMAPRLEGIKDDVNGLTEQWSALGRQLGDVWDSLQQLYDQLGIVGDVLAWLAVGPIWLQMKAWETLGYILYAVNALIIGVAATLGRLVQALKDAWFYANRFKEKLDELLSVDTNWFMPWTWLGGLPGTRGAGAGAPAGQAGTFGAMSAGAPAPQFTINVNAAPLGVHAGDIGAAVVDALRSWESRNGPVPLAGLN